VIPVFEVTVCEAKEGSVSNVSSPCIVAHFDAVYLFMKTLEDFSSKSRSHVGKNAPRLKTCYQSCIIGISPKVSVGVV
jgi:hypothetical protein